MNTSLRVADAYGMPVVVKVDSIIDGIIDKGNYYVAVSSLSGDCSAVYFYVFRMFVVNPLLLSRQLKV